MGRNDLTEKQIQAEYRASLRKKPKETKAPEEPIDRDLLERQIQEYRDNLQKPVEPEPVALKKTSHETNAAGEYVRNEAVFQELIRGGRAAPRRQRLDASGPIAAMRYLRGLGWALEDIGAVYGKTRAGIAYLLGPTGKRATRYPTLTMDELRMKLWKLIYDNPDEWYGHRGNDRGKVIEFIRSHGYGYDEADKAAKSFNIPLVQIVILFKYQVPISNQRAWLKVRQAVNGLSVRALFEGLELERIPESSFRRFYYGKSKDSDQ